MSYPNSLGMERIFPYPVLGKNRESKKDENKRNVNFHLTNIII
jgi:hypothetical protein